jgi:RNA recognition motif-containing protein
MSFNRLPGAWVMPASHLSLASTQAHNTATAIQWNDPMKLLVRNLARSTTEDEIRKLFEAYGKVQSCVLVKDKSTGKSKGFGFVEMPRPGDAKAARKNLNGKDIAGSRIRVKNAEQKTDSPEKSEPATDSLSEKTSAKSKKPAFNPWKNSAE